MPEELPPTVPGALNASAWAGATAGAAIDGLFTTWGGRRDVPSAPRLLGPTAIDLADWKDQRVGWGVILPERAGTDAAALATAEDAPECIRELVAQRSAPVFRHGPGLPDGFLRRYSAVGTSTTPRLKGERGNGANQVPWYLLIVASPAEIPWSVQYRLQTEAFVGRLDLPPEGLARYVDALLSDWSGAQVRRTRPLIWSADHGYPDITRLMRRTIGDPLAEHMRADAEFDMQDGHLTDARGTVGMLLGGLVDRRPAFVATTSHGATFPLDDAGVLAAQLGNLVDAGGALLSPAALQASGWAPDGMIWYAHACCSAGCDATSGFHGIAEPSSSLGRTLEALDRLPAMSAPLPVALLGHEKPARAFIGHVEPTFDWTLRDPLNGQVTTAHIHESLYQGLHGTGRPTIGMALERYRRAVAGALYDHAAAKDGLDAGVAGALEQVARTKLLARDLMAMVLLGDPAVRLAP